MLLARESVQLVRSAQTEGTLLATLLRTPTVIGTFTMPIQDRPQEVKVSPDGRTIAAHTNDQIMRFFDTRSHRQLRALPIGNADYAYVPTTGDIFAFSTPTGTPTDNGVVLADPRTGRILRTFGLSKGWVTTPPGPGDEPMVVTPDGRYGFLFWAAGKPDGSAGPAFAEQWRLDRGGHSKLVPLDGTDMLAAAALWGDRVMVATDDRSSTWHAR